MEVKLRGKNINEFLHIVMLSIQKMEMLLIQKLNMWIILLPKDTEFEEDHSYKTLLKMCLF